MKKKWFYSVILIMTIILIVANCIENYNIKKSIENDMYKDFNELSQLYEETVQILDEIISKSSVNKKEGQCLAYFRYNSYEIIWDIMMKMEILVSDDKYQKIMRDSYYPYREIDIIKHLVAYTACMDSDDYFFNDLVMEKIKCAKIYLADQIRIIDIILISKDYDKFSGFNKRYIFMDDNIYR